MVKLRLSRMGRSALLSLPRTEGSFAVLLARLREQCSGFVVELSEADFRALQAYSEACYRCEDSYQANAILEDAGIIA